MSLETQVTDVVNTGLGILKAGEETVTKAISDVEKGLRDAVANAEKTLGELKARGAADFSDPAMKTREVFATAARNIEALAGAKPSQN